MTKNFDGLKVELETNTARYDAAVRSGNNNGLRALLHAVKATAPKRWRPVSVDDFLDAIAEETLTAEQQDQIRTYTQFRSHVAVHKPGVRAWILAQGWSVETIDALKALSQVEGRYADPLLGDDDEEFSLPEIRRVVAQISKSHVVQQASPAAEAARQARRLLIKEYGKKIHLLRRALVRDSDREQEFVDFRNEIFATQGSDQADTDQVRAAMIDAKLAEEGING